MTTPELLDKRFVLCRPNGGLNDALCQIEKCWSYSRAFSRKLIIDFYGEPFLRSFFSRLAIRREFQSEAVLADHQTMLGLNAMQTFPPEVSGRLLTYRAVQVQGEIRSALFEYDSKARLSFNFRTDYEEQLVMHHSGGGGALGHRALTLFKVSDDTLASIAETLNFLPEEYDAAHVRATDYQTDYQAFFTRIQRMESSRPLVLLTDNYEVVRLSEAFLRGRDIVSFDKHELPPGEPIHRSKANQDSEFADRASFQLLCELFAVASARRFFYTSVRTPSPRVRQIFSGMSLLMASINRNPQLILWSMPEKNEWPPGRPVFVAGMLVRVKHSLFEFLRPFRRVLRAVSRSISISSRFRR